MKEEALATAKAILKLTAMDASLIEYISAAKTAPDLIQRLLLAQKAANFEVKWKKDAETYPVNEVSTGELFWRLKGLARDERAVIEEQRRKEKVSSKPKARSSTRPSVC